MKKIIFPLALAAVAMAISTVSMDVCARSLAQIKESGVLKVGSTGDYKPMSYLNKETGKYEGFDAEMAESLAKYLGVKLEYVPTKWKTLQQDTMDDKFDVGISGITVTDARRKVMTMSDGYLTFGKTILVTKAKKDSLSLSLMSTSLKLESCTTRVEQTKSLPKNPLRKLNSQCMNIMLRFRA
ncbi:transporter substrate-binding domain-containing protein [Turicimonas muris]|uniref:transporter substrate-binding domain-containing protein n=1 Tax=Turicimonas muris TaxID=1796652 RepID=UPI00257282AC|nr:transporter substrate-binding domain-containing protein [Turicimonas muris]